MYVGLVITSLGFIVPGILAWRRRFRREAIAGVLVSVTSVCYHGTLHPVAKWVDMTLAHTMGITSIGRACVRVCRRRWVDIGVLGGTLGSIAIYWFKSKQNPHSNSKYWHMLFHVSGQATWMVHLLSK